MMLLQSESADTGLYVCDMLPDSTMMRIQVSKTVKSRHFRSPLDAVISGGIAKQMYMRTIRDGSLCSSRPRNWTLRIVPIESGETVCY